MRTILTNRRYTGRQVWNRQRKQESLIDVDDVALGHTTRLAWNTSDTWVVSDELAHPAQVSDERFEQVQRRLSSRGQNMEGIRGTGSATVRTAGSGPVLVLRAEDAGHMES